MGEATKYTPPNTKQFDHPPTKKCRTMNRTPDEHVPVDVMPTPEAGCSIGNTTYVVLDPSPPPTPGPSQPAPDLLPHISGPSCSAHWHLQTRDDLEPPHTIPPSAPGPFKPTSRTHLMVLLDCLASLELPTTMELLSLMDQYEHGEKRYIDLHEELVDLGIKNAVQLYELPVELLASFGWLRQSSASRLQTFCRDKLLVPLGFEEEDSSSNDDNSPSAQSVVTIESSSDEDGDDEGVMAIMSSEV